MKVHRFIIKLLALITVLVACPVFAAESSDRERPNIIVLLTDDQRWDMIGKLHPILETPNIDRLASEGVLFSNNFCTTSICAVSRTSIMTGQYARRHQVTDFATGMSEEQIAQSYPGRLRAAGYHIAFVGKYGIGRELPRDSYDYFDGFAGQGVYMNEIDGKQVHMTRKLADMTLNYLKDAPTDKPYCLSVSFKAPHVQDRHATPFLYDPEFDDLYADITLPPPPKSDPKYFDMLPEFTKTSEGRTRWERRFSTPEKYQESVKGYYRLIAGVDRTVGEIYQSLEERGELDNTIIVFTSDNGFFLGEWGLAGKWLMHEESIRTPLIIRDPNLKKPFRGSTSEAMSLSIDIAPTVMSFAGVEIPEQVQGRSLVPLMQGARIAWRDAFFYEHLYEHGGRIPATEGVRTQDWKYTRYVSSGSDEEQPYEELIHLESDPEEINNLAASEKHSEKLSQMRVMWKQMREDLR